MDENALSHACFSQTPPRIYSPRYSSPLLPWSGRMLAVVLAAGSLAVLLTAVAISPSPTGEGTHTALGLLPCQFLINTGIPCISCGMTTSFAHFVRGHFLASVYVQPFGAVLAILDGCLFWSALYIAVTGRAGHRIFRFVNGPPIVWGMAILALLAWGWKIFIHVNGID